jgi:sulfatase maturation enzyme AslB (radical SAM superfamily)
MACDHACGNCTRLVAHYRKPWMMDFETFRKAVDSLSEYTGMVSMFGGEPTLHPDFQRMAEYLHAARNVPLGIGRSLQCRQPLHSPCGPLTCRLHRRQWMAFR